jgi:hypothetical protein
MNPHELRDPDEARLFLLQGLWLQRVLPPAPAALRAALEWSLEIAASGQPLPPVGFVADLGHVAFGLDWQARANRDDRPVPGVPAALLRAYEDHVLGKLYTDWTFAEAGEHLRTYEGRDRARGLAFVANQFRQRAGFPGVELSPGVIKAVLEEPPEEALAGAWESLDRDGVRPRLGDLLHALVTAARRTAEVLGREDLFELKRRTALDPLGQRVALRQVLRAAADFEDALPRHRPRPPSGRREVPTRILDEDTYPVGGFASLSNRGTVESLLHSQLAFMEGERPDLFDVKYLRDELLYYSRDENQFLRRRRTFAVVLFPDLAHTRFKDAELPYQRVVLLWALLVVLDRRLSGWLSTDALKFVFFFVTADGGEAPPLAAELALLRTLLQEQMDNGTVEIVDQAMPGEVARECTLRARRSLCQCLTVATTDTPLAAADTVLTRLVIAGPRPGLAVDGAPPAIPETEEPLDAWHAVLQQLLQRWV